MYDSPALAWFLLCITFCQRTACSGVETIWNISQGHTAPSVPNLYSTHHAIRCPYLRLPLVAGRRSQSIVHGHFSDGSQRTILEWASFAASLDGSQRGAAHAD